MVAVIGRRPISPLDVALRAPSFVIMAEVPNDFENDPVSTTWTQMVQFVLGAALLVGTGILMHYFAPPRTDGLQEQVHQLTAQVQQLRQEQTMPSTVLTRYRDSICYIFGVYRVGFPNRAPELRARVSGTGFVVSSGLVATNRHVAEPWYGDPDADALIRKGATPQLERLLAFFPGMPTPIEITPMVESAH